VTGSPQNIILLMMSVLNFKRWSLIISFVRLVLAFFKLVLLIQFLQLVLNSPFDIGICSSAASLVQSNYPNRAMKFCTATTNINFFAVFLPRSNDWPLIPPITGAPISKLQLVGETVRVTQRTPVSKAGLGENRTCSGDLRYS
jgi:hypothetical protein